MIKKMCRDYANQYPSFLQAVKREKKSKKGILIVNDSNSLVFSLHEQKRKRMKNEGEPVT